MGLLFLVDALVRRFGLSGNSVRTALPSDGPSSCERQPMPSVLDAVEPDGLARS